MFNLDAHDHNLLINLLNEFVTPNLIECNPNDEKIQQYEELMGKIGIIIVR